MDVVPVLDLLDGHVVRGIGGRREEYRPWASPLASGSSRPRDVAIALIGQYSPRAIYAADLNGIRGARPDPLDWLEGINIEVWLDAGFGTVERLESWSTTASKHARPILGLESLASSDELERLFQAGRERRPIFSLDLKQGRTLTTIDAWRDIDPLLVVDKAVAAGFGHAIVLDLTDVGSSGGGSTHALCRRIAERHPQLKLVAGGGVRSLEDLRRWREAGCAAALVATALHTGALTPEEAAQA